jgi:hypothetical protein
LREFLLGDVGQLFEMVIEDGFVEFLEELQAFGGDANGDDAAVAGIALPGDRAAGFEAVEEAGDVGVARDHAFADFFAGEAVGFCEAEDSQDVVLCDGEFIGFKELIETAHEMVGGPHEAEEHFLLEAVEGLDPM